ncbi:MAG: hypothetical protein Q3X94_09985, partial [Oscillospiraceae bacterium]|nr:hypothetical protein [Oscillospiraceae bacterium]
MRAISRFIAVSRMGHVIPARGLNYNKRKLFSCQEDFRYFSWNFSSNPQKAWKMPLASDHFGKIALIPAKSAKKRRAQRLSSFLSTLL